MQTFLPHPDFEQSARLLDYRRLGKQRIECKQILKALARSRSGKPYGWKTHTATRMWEGHDSALIEYGIAMCNEWRARGYVDNQLRFFRRLARVHPPPVKPKWIGNEEVHASHRSNLLRKAPEFYQQFGWKESADLPYVWPTNPKDTHV